MGALGNGLDYNFNATLVPTAALWPFWQRPYNLNRALRTAQVLMAADANNYDFYANLFSQQQSGFLYPGPEPWRFGVRAGGAFAHDQPILPGPNTDDLAGRGYVRYRHADDRLANALYMDGHVQGQTLEGGVPSILNANFRAD